MIEGRELWGIAAISLSIVGLLFYILFIGGTSFFSYPLYISSVLSVLAMAFAFIQRKINPTKEAKIGMVIGIAMLIIDIVSIALVTYVRSL